MIDHLARGVLLLKKLHHVLIPNPSPYRHLAIGLDYGVNHPDFPVLNKEVSFVKIPNHDILIRIVIQVLFNGDKTPFNHVIDQQALFSDNSVVVLQRVEVGTYIPQLLGLLGPLFIFSDVLLPNMRDKPVLKVHEPKKLISRIREKVVMPYEAV